MPALCSGLSLRSSPEHSPSPSLYLVQQAATDGPELTATSGPRLLAKLKYDAQIFTDKADKLADALARDVSHQSAFEPQIEIAQPAQDIAKTLHSELGRGIELGLGL